MRTNYRLGIALGAFVVFGSTLTGCSSTAATAPTAQSVSTQAAPTAQSLATQAAPTARAAGTQAAPTIQALATQAAPLAATVSASEPVRVSNVNMAAQDSTITLQDAGTQPVDLSNWTVQVGSAHATLPSGANVQPGQSVTLHTAAGTSTPSDVFLGQDAQAIASQLRPGVEIVVNNPTGSPVSSFVVPNG